MSGQEAADILFFDGFRLDRQGLFRVHSQGIAEPVALGARALDLLRMLAEHSGEIVSKDELIATAWLGSAVEESNLTVQISALRRVLNINPGSYIQTVPGRGYRFIKEVSRASPRSSAEPAVADGEKPSIAVLPFQNMSGDPEQEYFADGMVEEVITAIARCPGLFVIARNSTYAYKGKSVDVKQVAQELGVRYVLEGSVRKAGNRVRIAGQLIDSATGAHVWADRFDGTLDDIFEFQDRVAGGVVGAIEPRLRRAEAERAVRKPTASLAFMCSITPITENPFIASAVDDERTNAPFSGRPAQRRKRPLASHIILGPQPGAAPIDHRRSGVHSITPRGCQPCAVLRRY